MTEEISYNGAIPVNVATKAVRTDQAALTSRWITVGTVTYSGEAVIGSATSAAVWRVSKTDTSTGAETWADGNDNFDNVWDDYATLTYA